ncbi:unnamed protein product [Effrenium voratum]|nr:unnamed protein product [Effrenium voratum]
MTLFRRLATLTSTPPPTTFSVGHGRSFTTPRAPQLESVASTITWPSRCPTR